MQPLGAEVDHSMKHKAIIFDMDGLLLDSERIALEAFFEASEQLGFRVDMDVYLRCIGTNAEGTREILTDALGPDFPLEELGVVWTERHAAKTARSPVPPMDGAQELLDWSSSHQLPMAVATSSNREDATEKLRNAGLLHYFSFLVCGDEVERGKPDPEIYTRASDKLGILSSDCLALEDSDNGVRAAHAAGMTVIHVPDLIEPSDMVKSLSYLTLRSLHDVVIYLEGGT